MGIEFCHKYLARFKTNKKKIRGIERKKKHTGRGNNPRIKPTEQIKDENLQRELKDGAVLVSYSSTNSIT